MAHHAFPRESESTWILVHLTGANEGFDYGNLIPRMAHSNCACYAINHTTSHLALHDCICTITPSIVGLIRETFGPWNNFAPLDPDVIFSTGIHSRNSVDISSIIQCVTFDVCWLAQTSV